MGDGYAGREMIMGRIARCGVGGRIRGPSGGRDSVADLARQRGVDRSVVEAEFFKTARPSSLLKRFATVDEVANMVVYVCSPLASATNGAALRVDGGVIRAIV